MAEIKDKKLEELMQAEAEKPLLEAKNKNLFFFFFQYECND